MLQQFIISLLDCNNTSHDYFLGPLMWTHLRSTHERLTCIHTWWSSLFFKIIWYRDFHYFGNAGYSSHIKYFQHSPYMWATISNSRITFGSNTMFGYDNSSHNLLMNPLGWTHTWLISVDLHTHLMNFTLF